MQKVWRFTSKAWIVFLTYGSKFNGKEMIKRSKRLGQFMDVKGFVCFMGVVYLCSRF